MTVVVVAVEVVPDVVLVVEVVVFVEVETVVVDVPVDVEVVFVDVVEVEELAEVVVDVTDEDVETVEVLVDDVEEVEIEVCVEVILVAGFRQDVIRKIENVRTININANFFISFIYLSTNPLYNTPALFYFTLLNS